ncbi:hypothetical protein Ddc_20316 [Ditylenchus destructor]|nr:hypothetical protein Ddc_20316 [Ditylenchus destructor]
MTLDREKATEIQERLNVQLVSTVGPYGTSRGLSLQDTKRHKDWNESLEDYARDLGYFDVLQMLEDMKDSVRLEHDSESNEFRVRAVNSEKLSHCFWLIDRTKDIPDARYSKSDFEFEEDPNAGWLDPEYKENIEIKTCDVKITLADPYKYSNFAGYPPIYLRLNEPDDWTGIVERRADEKELRRILGQK